MKISQPPISKSSELTVDADLDMLSTYQVKALASPASTEALRKGSKDITNAEVADAAAIDYVKLALTGLIRDADIKSDAAIALSKLALDLTTHASRHQDGGADEINATGLVGLPFKVYKTADEVVANSNTLQNDDHLLFAVAANEIWFFILMFKAVEDTSPGGNIKWAFAVPTNGTISRFLTWSTTGAAMVNGTTAASDTNLADAILYYMHAYHYVGGDTAGNVQFQWAQNTSGAPNTRVKQNSFILAFQIK